MAFPAADLLLVTVVALSAASAAATSIHGCGGFVEASRALVKARRASGAKLDYSHITVELQTNDGLIKERTQCAPNGYYFIPVYDKGSFVVKVKGPDGWSWNPDSVPVIIDQNGCNSNADINFQFTGFSISGKVRGAFGGDSCSSKDGGPSDVNVQLLSLDGDVVSSGRTSDVGSFSFTNISPGKYQLRASNPKIEVRGSTEVELGLGNVVVDDVFFTTGYEIRGFVVAQGNPILGVHVYLYSDDVTDVHCPQGHGNAPGQHDSLCHAVSDADGKFTFTSIPCGVYKLVPYYKGENTVFDVSPPSIVVSVEHDDVRVGQQFQVTGFSVGGRVVDGDGVGVGGVKIIVDGQQKAVTDIHGNYKLDQVTSMRYTIQAKKTHYKFRTLENYLVLPNMVAIPDIEAVAYDLCGAVRLVNRHQNAKVALTHGPENSKPQVKQADADGSFCLEVSPGEYRLSALAVEFESSTRLVFSPPYIDVTVKGPISDIEFTETQIDIYGTITCKDKCSRSILLSLEKYLGKSQEDIKTVALVDDDSFMFSKVSSGKYQLKVKHSSSPTASEDDWCWDQNIIDLDVHADDIMDIIFAQKGYMVDMISTHDVNVSIQQPDYSIEHLPIKRGSQRLCIKSPGVHTLHFDNSCIFFGSPSMTFNTLNPKPIYLKGEKYILKGEIHIRSGMLDDPSLFSSHLVVDILNEEQVLVDTIQTTFASHGSARGTLLFEYSALADLQETLIFVPRDTRLNNAKKILFYPKRRHISVTNAGCQPTISPIIGKKGLYIEGSVSPATSDVNIQIFSEENSDNAEIEKGQLAFETQTGTGGHYIAGPLYDDTSYNVVASKQGYYLKSVGPSSFSCQKLSQISVHISSIEMQDVFPPVLLSLSGEDGYRNNTVAAAGGSFIFDNLFPGSFYLRPLLKEYSFSPSAQAIELGSGESKEVIFQAARVAYSVFGTVSLLSGQPKGGVYLEARSESKVYYEETTTDSFGNYRLRGLLPHTTYSIKVVTKKQLKGVEIERTSPESVSVEVGTEDITGLDFVIFEQPEMTIISGHVEGTDLEELQPYLSIEVKSEKDPAKILAVFPLPLSYYFQVRDLPRGKHLVELVSHLSSPNHRFESEVLEVDLEERSQIHVGPLKYKIEESHHKQDITPAPVFPLIVGLAVIVLFISMPRIKDLYHLAFGAASTTTKREAHRPILRKKL